MKTLEELQKITDPKEFKAELKKIIKDAFVDGIGAGYCSAQRYEEIDDDETFNDWYEMNYENKKT